ncbi:MAG: thiamine phosphate synthase [Aeromicrobium sp.]|nr:thiamine phosphate synthase [Burkholderiales bacterium]
MASVQDTRSALRVGHRVAGVYAITPDHLDSASLLSTSKLLFAAGVRNIQYRRKLTPAKAQLIEAQHLQLIAKSYGANLIINDNLALALEIGASGVHWGRDDVGSANIESLAREINDARVRAAGAGLLAPLMVGISCYNDFARAQIAADAGASYVAFGSMFPSSTKPFAAAAPISLIYRGKRELGIPVVAIGGITRDNAATLIDAGVDAIAVISDLFSAASNVELVERVTAFQRLFELHSVTTNETY